MHPIKIENFKRDFPDKDFPRYQALSEQQVKRLLTNLAGNLSAQVDVDSVLSAIRERSIALTDVDASSESFRLEATLRQASIEISREVSINWGRFEEIDRMEMEPLTKWFDYIWYPGSDDIEIIPADVSWIASIHHHGEVALLKF